MGQYRVLIVEDEAIQRQLIRDVLRTSNNQFEVFEARNGLEALDVLRKQTVDAVLVDKRMPVQDGDTLCRNIRTNLNMPLLPIIMVTGTNAVEEIKRSFAAGANDFIHKPYNPIELLARLTGAVTTKRLTDQLDTAENLLFALARMVEAKDETTGNHCSRLMHMGQVFGRVLGLSDLELDAMRKGGVVHDIGKLGIPDSILLKAGPLTEEEWELMRTHTTIGGHLCAGLTSMREALPIILYHHERWDGSGYPHGLKGEQIPKLARVFQLLDIYDALISLRPYKQPLTLEQIITVFEREASRGWRDPTLVDAFLEILKTNPEQLKIPKEYQPSEDERIFQAIAKTGVMQWDKKKAQTK